METIPYKGDTKKRFSLNYGGRMMKKFSVIMLAAVLSFGAGGMSACGGGGDDGGDTDTVKVVKVWRHQS